MLHMFQVGVGQSPQFWLHLNLIDKIHQLAEIKKKLEPTKTLQKM